MNVIAKATSILKAFKTKENSIDYVDTVLSTLSIDNISRIDYWLDVRNVLSEIA